MSLWKFISGFSTGLGVGLSLGLLLAPQSGEKTQALIREKVDWVMEEGHKAAQEKRQELEAELAADRQPVSQSF